jgi:DNA-binding MarR family transcriptional regulator
MTRSSPTAGCPADRSAGDACPAAAEVVEALVGVVHLLQRFADARIARCGLPIKLTGARLRALHAVEQAGCLRMGDLAAELRVTPRTVTDLVAGLEQAGLLARRPDPADGRATLLELGPAACDRSEQVRGLREEVAEEMLAPLSGEERRQLLDLLRRLTSGALCDPEDRPWSPASAKAGRA